MLLEQSEKIINNLDQHLAECWNKLSFLRNFEVFSFLSTISTAGK